MAVVGGKCFNILTFQALKLRASRMIACCMDTHSFFESRQVTAVGARRVVRCGVSIFDYQRQLRAPAGVHSPDQGCVMDPHGNSPSNVHSQAFPRGHTCRSPVSRNNCSTRA